MLTSILIPCLFYLFFSASCSASVIVSSLVNNISFNSAHDSVTIPEYNSHFSSSILHQDIDHHIDGRPSKDSYLLPHNISIVLLKWHPQPSIRVSWSYEGTICEAFRIIYHPITSRYRYIIEVPCYIRNVTIERLIPSTEYILTINPVPLEPDPDVKSINVFDQTPRTKTPSGKKVPYTYNAPNVIRFISPQTEYNRFSKFRSSSLIIRKSPIDDQPDGSIVKTGELCVVIFVLCGWFLIIFIFIRKWGKIRGIETVATLDTSNIGRASINVVDANSTGVNPFTFLSNQRSSSNHSSALNSLKQQRSKDSDDTQCAIPGGCHTATNPTMTMMPTVDAPVRQKKLSDAMSLFLGDASQRSVFHHRYSHGDINQTSLYQHSSESYGNQDYPDHDINCVIELGLSCNCKKCRINSKGFLSPLRRTSWALLESIPEKDNGFLNDSRRYKSAENLSSSLK